MNVTRVAHLVRTYGVHGGERQLGQYLRLASKEKEVDAFLFVYHDRQCREYFASLTDILLKDVLPVSIQPRKNLWVEFGVLLGLLPLLQLRLLWLLWRGGYNVCVVHGFQAALAAWLAAVLLRSCGFVYVHRGTKSRLGRNPLFKVIYWPYAVVAGVSKAVAESLKPVLGARVARVIENGIDWESVARRAADCRDGQKNKFVVICVGRLIPGKGQDCVLQAFAELVKSSVAAELWVIGDGPDRTLLERQAHNLGVAYATCFLGRREDVACLLGRADTFVHASASEGLSNAVLEAMAAGLPSVVVEAPGVTECHVAEVTGFIVPRDAHAVAEKLLVLSRDAALRKRMAEAAQERVRSHYSMEANRLRYRALYDGLVGVA